MKRVGTMPWYYCKKYKPAVQTSINKNEIKVEMVYQIKKNWLLFIFGLIP